MGAEAEGDARMRKFLLVMPLLAWQSQAAAAAKNVMILVLDGARYSETWGDKSRQHIPQLANVLGDLGITHRFSLGAELGTFFEKAGVLMDAISGERSEDESKRVKVDPALR